MAAISLRPSSLPMAELASPFPSSPGLPQSGSLVQSCLEDNERAWELLFEATSPIISAICRRDFHLHREDTEDVVQIVHLTIYLHLKGLRNTACFDRWLRRVTRRTIMVLLQERRQTLSLDAILQETGREVPDRASWGDPWTRSARTLCGVDARLVVRLDVWQALASLPLLYREPVVYYLLSGKPQDEIGRLLGRPRSTVATQIQRGLEKLRRQLAEAYHQGSTTVQATGKPSD